MIELIHILRAIVVSACNKDLNNCGTLTIKFSQLEQLVFDVLWGEKRIAIYSTAWEMKQELERLSDLEVIRYESDEIKIEPGEFLKKIEPFMLVSKNMTAGNAYLKHIIREIEDGARRYAVENLLVPKPA